MEKKLPVSFLRACLNQLTKVIHQRFVGEETSGRTACNIAYPVYCIYMLFFLKLCLQSSGGSLLSAGLDMHVKNLLVVFFPYDEG